MNCVRIEVALIVQGEYIVGFCSKAGFSACGGLWFEGSEQVCDRGAGFLGGIRGRNVSHCGPEV